MTSISTQYSALRIARELDYVTYEAKVEAHAATRLAIFCQHCQRKATADEDEEQLGDVKPGFCLCEFCLWDSHADSDLYLVEVLQCASTGEGSV